MKLPNSSFEEVPLQSLSAAVLRNALPISDECLTPCILVVDDDRKVADTLVHILELNGFAAEAAYSGHQGIERARALRPFLIISDVGMPVMDGLTMIDTINSFLPEVQVVMICEQLPRNLAIPSWSVIKKPVRALELLTVLEPTLRADA